MKKLIITLTILISTIFTNIAFADVIIPGESQYYSFNENCYSKCLEIHNNDWSSFGDECKFKCASSVRCEIPFKAWYNELKGENFAYYRHFLMWDCSNSGKLIQFLGKHSMLMNIIILIIIAIIGIFIYKRKKSKLG